MTTITVQGIQMSRAAAGNVEETATDVAADLRLLRRGIKTSQALLEDCLDGADADREQGWYDYVEALTAVTEEG